MGGLGQANAPRISVTGGTDRVTWCSRWTVPEPVLPPAFSRVLSEVLRLRLGRL